MTLLELLKPYFDKAFEIFEKTGEFILDIAPELVQQFYISRLLHHGGIVLGMLTLALVGHYVFNQCSKPIPEDGNMGKYYIKWRGRYLGNDEFEQFLVLIFLEVIPKLTAIVTILVHTYKLLLLKFAPYIYMLEWITDLTAKAK